MNERWRLRLMWIGRPWRFGPWNLTRGMALDLGPLRIAWMPMRRRLLGADPYEGREPASVTLLPAAREN